MSNSCVYLIIFSTTASTGIRISADDVCSSICPGWQKAYAMNEGVYVEKKSIQSLNSFRLLYGKWEKLFEKLFNFSQD